MRLRPAVPGGGGSQNSTTIEPPAADKVDQALRDLVQARGLTGDPATPRGLEQQLPAEVPLVELGQILFFSRTLSAGYDVSCGTCHHPDFGASDGLSLPVGVVPKADTGRRSGPRSPGNEPIATRSAVCSRS